MKKIIIFTASTGAGHNACAYALKEKLERSGHNVIVKDPYTLKSEKSAKHVSNNYYNMVRYFPNTFGFVYNIGKIYDSLNLPSPIYQISKKHTLRVASYLIKEDPDVVICTQLLAMEIMTSVIKAGLYLKPCYAQLTDYTFYPFMKDTLMDGYFVSHEGIKDEVLKANIEEDKIYYTGIPISSKFDVKVEKEEALKKLNLNISKDLKIVTISSGSVGSKIVDKLVKKLLKLNLNIYLIVLTGSNKAQYDKLTKLALKYDNLKVVSFTKEFNLYLSISDCIIAKPGGLSTTEIISYKVPLIHLKSIPGLESDNAMFFASHGCSKYAPNIKYAIKYLNDILYNELELKSMLECQEEIFKHNDQTLIERLIDNHE